MKWWAWFWLRSVRWGLRGRRGGNGADLHHQADQVSAEPGFHDLAVVQAEGRDPGDPHGSARSRYALESTEVGADQVVQACDSVVFRGDRLDRETRVGEAIQERLDGDPVTAGVEWFRGEALLAVAARVGTTRLIDNMLVAVGQD